jgi:hypothetical protein
MKALPLFRDYFLYSEEPTIVFVILSCVLQKHKFDRKAQQLYLTDGDIYMIKYSNQTVSVRIRLEYGTDWNLGTSATSHFKGQ